MKLVVNKCFGGFSLSMFGEKEYLKRKGKKAFFYRKTKYTHSDKVDEYSKLKDTNENTMFFHCFTKDLGESFSKWPKKLESFSGRDIKRDDQDLIAIVEKHGAKINGQCAKLEIIEIPDGVDYQIDDYDGLESVHEKHRSW
jgi:hypothetical protein